MPPDPVRIPYRSTAVVDGDLRTVDRALVVHDHGTGLAATLSDRLAFGDADLRDDPASVAAGGSDDEQLAVELRPGVGGAVLVSSTGRAPLEFRADEVPAEVLGRVCGLELSLAHGTWLHGAAVTDGTATVLVVGESGAGKSTVTAHLCALGLDLLSDEQVAVHPAEGLVASFTRPVLLKPGALTWAPPAAVAAAQGHASGQQVLVRPGELGVRCVLAARPTHLVLIRRDDATSTSVRSLGHAEAAQRLCEHSLDLAARPEAALDGLGWLGATVAAADIGYPSSEQGAAAILQWVAATPPPEPTQRRVRTWTPEPGAEGLVADPAVLALDVDDEVVLFHRTTRVVLRLNAAAAAWWHELPVPHDPGAPLDELSGTLVEHGLVDLIGTARAARRARFAAALERSEVAPEVDPAPWAIDR